MTEKTPIFCHFIIIIYQYCFSKKLIKIPNYSNMLIIQVYVNLTHKRTPVNKSINVLFFNTLDNCNHLNKLHWQFGQRNNMNISSSRV